MSVCMYGGSNDSVEKILADTFGDEAENQVTKKTATNTP